MSDYEFIFVGSGFASSFFLKKRLQTASRSARYLVLERGPMVSHAAQLDLGENSPIEAQSTFRVEGDTAKQWIFNIGFGGSSVCWWAGVPRMLPNDFTMKTIYGVGRDWPIQYDDLAPFYAEAEEIMQVAGSTDSPFPAGKGPAYPLPGHRMTDPDRRLKAAFPDQYFNQPTARASRSTDTRAQCCANAVCHLCPIDAKFTILNGMRDVYDDPRVTLVTEAEVTEIETTSNVARGVRYRDAEGRSQQVRGDAVVLGANAIFNPYLLLRSGIEDGPVGQRLHEQGAFRAFIYYDGLSSFQGSTAVTGQGYMLYDGPHRADVGGALIEGWNRPLVRKEFGRWREMSELYIIVEDLPEDDNRVLVDPEDERRPLLRYGGHSDYLHGGVARVKEKLPELLASLPVERIGYSEITPSEAHNQGTTVFGDNPATSVVDRDLVHHRVRNLYVLGNSVFPTGAPANPTLTNVALALRAAEQLA